MKKIFLFMLCLQAAITTRGQEAVAVPVNDSLAAPQPTTAAAPQQYDELKAAGDSAYMHNDYAAAIERYEALLKEGESPVLYYNLGNSYYKSDDIARAVLNYERALLLAPGNADIRANLEIARAKTVDKVMPVPRIFFVAWTMSLINMLGADQWGRVAVVAFFLLLASFCLYLLAKQVRWKKAGFIVMIACLVVTLLGNLFAFQQKRKLTERNDAIVLTPSATVRSTPSESGTSLFVLHEGRKVEVKDRTMRNWWEIRLEDGKVGWLPAESIEII
ncbi:MAG: tetratricopeptide repeat protein [Prevotellaceae bacterium]|jgi:tetratricopeptide (TPR) repeat protein|nr:tetratricopeptide repeat protein [Prevotellaceae bacterium]